MILYNPIKQDVETDNHYLPAIHVDGPSDAAARLRQRAHEREGARGRRAPPTPTQADVMATFSSRGPTGDWIKPDVTAPGVQVLAGTTPQPDQTTADNGPPGNLYQAIAGTSMSSPHAAGVSALVKAAHPDLDAGGDQVGAHDLVGADRRQGGRRHAGRSVRHGAGSIRADRAVNPTLVFDETYADFVAAGADPLHRIDLNIASVDATDDDGRDHDQPDGDQRLRRRARRWTSRSGAARRGVIVSDKVGNERPKATTIHFEQERHDRPSRSRSALRSVANGQYSGRITLDADGTAATPVTIPVAFVKKQGAVTLTHTCSRRRSATKTGVSHCTVDASPTSAARRRT